MRLKKTLKLILKATLLFLASILFYLAAGYCLSRITVDEEPNAKKEIPIYILTNGVHTDIVLPIKTAQYNWSEKVKFSNAAAVDSSYNYLAMGWGDKGFYLETPEWSDLKFSVAFKAAFGLSKTAIHATYYKSLKENSSCKKIMVSTEQYNRLLKYTIGSFKKDKKGSFINIKTSANYSKTDAFYEANGSYSMLHTCNTWANEALKKCGQKACLWTPFDTGIFLKYN